MRIETQLWTGALRFRLQHCVGLNSGMGVGALGCVSAHWGWDWSNGVCDELLRLDWRTVVRIGILGCGLER